MESESQLIPDYLDSAGLAFVYIDTLFARCLTQSKERKGKDQILPSGNLAPRQRARARTGFMFCSGSWSGSAEESGSGAPRGSRIQSSPDLPDRPARQPDLFTGLAAAAVSRISFCRYISRQFTSICLLNQAISNKEVLQEKLLTVTLVTVIWLQ